MADYSTGSLGALALAKRPSANSIQLFPSEVEIVWCSNHYEALGDELETTRAALPMKERRTRAKS